MRDVQINVALKNSNIVFDQRSNSLSINNKNITENIKADIISLSVLTSSIIVIFDTEELKSSVIDSYREKGIGNMLSFSPEGVLLWRTEDILCEHHFPFSCGHILSDADKDSYTKWHGVLFNKKHEYFDAMTLADEHYIIDVTENRLLAKIVRK